MSILNISPVIRRTVLIAYWLVMFTSTHWPDISRYRPATGWPIPFFGTVMHVGVYFIWTILWCWVLAGARKLTLRSMILLLVAGAIYAAFDEGTQSFVDRSPDPGDLISDLVGIPLGLIFSAIVQRQSRRWGSKKR